MPVICWGPLGKAADDPTTINDDISAYILRHDVSPTAHGLDGYSLFNHRDDPYLDHVDYSVISNKITTNQIVGKDFRTAPDVGDGVDGIKFDKDAIEMWDSGYQKVYIPRTGNPVFDGILTIRELSFFRRIVQVNCQSLDPFNSSSNLLVEGTHIEVDVPIHTYTPARARITTGVGDDILNWAKNPSLEISAGFLDWNKELVYMCLGNSGFNDCSFTGGFLIQDRVCYALSKTFDNDDVSVQYTLPLFDVNTRGMYIYKVKYNSTTRFFDYYINNVLRGSLYGHNQAIEDDTMFDVFVYTKSAAHANFALYNVLWQQEFPV